MIACQKCGIAEDAGEGLRILPFLAANPDSCWDWLAYCRACLEEEVRERKQAAPIEGHLPLATPAWKEAERPSKWHRRMLGEMP